MEGGKPFVQEVISFDSPVWLWNGVQQPPVTPKLLSEEFPKRNKGVIRESGESSESQRLEKSWDVISSTTELCCQES